MASVTNYHNLGGLKKTHNHCLTVLEVRSLKSLFFFNLFIYLFIYLWLCWVFVSVRGLSLVVASGGHSSSRCAGLLLSRPLLLWSTGSRCAGSVIVAHGPSCSVACGILPDQGSNPCPLHWQADSQPLRHQGSPEITFIGLNSGIGRATLPPEALGENLFPCLFQLLEMHSLYSLPVAHSTIFKANSIASCFGGHSAFFCVKSLPQPSSYKDTYNYTKGPSIKSRIFSPSQNSPLNHICKISFAI